MENSERITKAFFRELTDLELMLGIALLPGLLETFPRNPKLNAMYLDVCEAAGKFMNAERNNFSNGNFGATYKLKAREVFYTKLETLVEILSSMEERDRQAHLN